jgi:apolipoprotein N-acyltransferase
LQAEQLVKVEPAATASRALLVQQDVPIKDEWTAESYDKLLNQLSAISIRPASTDGQPGLVVWPESPAPFVLDDARFVQTVADIARRSNAYVVAGTIGLTDQAGNSRNIYNSAVLVAPDGSVRQRYDKVHLVPFGEYVPFKDILSFASSLTSEVGTFVPGNDRIPLAMDGHKVGVFICYESVFPGEVRQFAEHGAEVF